MDWEKRLKELEGYNIAFEIKQGYYHISIVFDDDWEIILPEDENIYLEKRNGVCHYIVSTDASSIDNLFKAVDTTIEYNMDLQRKLILFKKKTEELQEIFANEPIEILETIEFKYGKKQPKKKEEKQPKKKKGRPKKEEKPEPQPVEEENFVNEDINDEEEVIIMGDGYMQELER